MSGINQVNIMNKSQEISVPQKNESGGESHDILWDRSHCLAQSESFFCKKNVDKSA